MRNSFQMSSFSIHTKNCSMNKYYMVWCSLLSDMKKGNSLGWRRRGRHHFSPCTPSASTPMWIPRKVMKQWNKDKTVPQVDSCVAPWTLKSGLCVAVGKYCQPYGVMAGQLWKSVAGFCLENSPSLGSVLSLSDFRAPWPAYTWP